MQRNLFIKNKQKNFVYLLQRNYSICPFASKQDGGTFEWIVCNSVEFFRPFKIKLGSNLRIFRNLHSFWCGKLLVSQPDYWIFKEWEAPVAEISVVKRYHFCEHT